MKKLILIILLYSSNSNGQYIFTKIWDKTLGGNQNESNLLFPGSLRSYEQNDGDLLICGNSTSNVSGEKSQSCFGQNDVWMVLINNNGQKIWDRDYGGFGYDVFADLTLTNNNRHLLTISSASFQQGC